MAGSAQESPLSRAVGHERLAAGPLRLSNPLAMKLAPELAADILGLGECFLVLATDGENHPLTALDLIGRRDAQPVIGRSQRGQDLDGEVSLGRVVEEGDDPKLALRALDGTRPDLRHFHGD
jgi:hypothetical protein